MTSSNEGHQAASDNALELRICFCHAVSEATIREAIRNGARTLEQVQTQTKASTGCGGCTCEVERLLEEEQNTKS